MNPTITHAGIWLVNKARRQQAEIGTYQATRNLKKQGVPLLLALDILAPVRGRV